MRECIEDDCHADISSKGNRAKRCDEHQLAFHASRERDRYSRVKDGISTRRILRRQGAPEYEGPADDKIVDYSAGGEQRPRLDPNFPYRQNPRHDHARRVQMDHANSGEADMSSWSDLVAMRQSGRWVDFPAASMEPAPDPLGRSAPRSRGLYSRNDSPGELINPAVEGMAFVRSPAAGQRALQAQKQGNRFGPNVDSPVQITSGMLASPPPNMVWAEISAQVEERIASDHMHTQAGYSALRR